MLYWISENSEILYTSDSNWREYSNSKIAIFAKDSMMQPHSVAFFFVTIAKFKVLYIIAFELDLTKLHIFAKLEMVIKSTILAIRTWDT